MIILYNLSVLFLRFIFTIASVFQPKAKAFVSGRKDIFHKLQEAFKNNSQPVIWVHCASLGEFEQGRSIIELFKKEKSGYKILLTFFSPSGYEIRKDYKHADYVFYLPWDTASNARRFVEITNPVLSIFVKYEFWYHYTRALNKRKIPVLSVSSIFRNDQLFFKSYGRFYRSILKRFTFFFVQNQASVNLLHSIGIMNCKRAGDTRFDRVITLTNESANIPEVENFKENNRTWIIGSCWPEDLKVLAPFINRNDGNVKFIIAPHEIGEAFIAAIEKELIVKSIRFSQTGLNTIDANVLIIDNIGMLSKLYRYGEFAYIGGAFGKGLHNILEAACYGIPIFFGNSNYKKFQEANDLIKLGGAFAVADYDQLLLEYNKISRAEHYSDACNANLNYVKQNLGATNMIMEYCNKLLRV